MGAKKSSFESKKEVALGVLELIRQPHNWTQKAYARNEFAEEVDWDAQNAVCWCLAGAFHKIAKDVGLEEEVRMDFRQHLHKAEFGSSAVVFNDTHSHSTVIRELENFCRENGYVP